MVRDIEEWLKRLKLWQYAQAFVDQDIEQDLLLELSEDDLTSLGVKSLGHRKRLMKAIRALSEDARREDPSAPVPVAGALADRPGEADTKGEIRGHGEHLRHLTIMFVDLVDSTALSERLDLEDYWEAIASYQLCCTDVIRDFHGFVARYLGDGVLAYFGYPQAVENDAERAVAAGLEIARAVTKVENKQGLVLKARIGVATGKVLISDLAKGRVRITDEVLGRAPNLAARLQTVAKPGTVVISESTRVLLGKQFEVADMGSVRLKGFSEPVSAWQVRKVDLAASRFDSRQKGPMTPFTGRDEELALLRNRWAAATRYEGRVVLISGEAGIGKSRLVESLLGDIEGEPHLRVRYQCSPYHTRSALYPIIAQLAYAAEIRGRDADDVKLDKLERLLRKAIDNVKEVAPLFARLLSIPGEGRYGVLDEPSETLKEATKFALLDQCFGLAEKGPIVVVFEDIHWIDPSTEELLGALMGSISSRCVLVLCTYRPEYFPLWTGDVGVSTLHLGRLDRRQSLEMVQQSCRGRTLPSDISEAIARKAEGVPLFIEELTKTVLEADGARSGRNVKVIGKDAASLTLPSTLNELLMAKLDSLPGAQEVVQISAAAGRTFTFRLLSMVSGLPDDRLQATLGQLIGAQVLVQRGQHADATYSFRHALIQEAAYATMLRSRMKSLHARIADTLVSRLPEYAARNAEVVAHHYSRGEMPRKARDFWASAGERAIERSAYIEAIAHLESALLENAKLDDRHDRSTTEITLRERIVIPLEARFWGSDDIASNYHRLHELQSEFGNDKDLFAVLHGLYGTHIIAGMADMALEYAAKMAAIAESLDDDALALLSCHAMGMCCFEMGDFEEALKQYASALRLRSGLSPDATRRYYLADIAVVDRCMQAWAYALLGDAENAKQMTARAAESTEAADLEFSCAYGLSILASVHQTMEHPSDALAYASRALELSRHRRFRYWETWAQILHGWATAASGTYDKGIEELSAGLDSYVQTGSKQIILYAKTLLADAYRRAGSTLSGLALMEEIESEEESCPVRFHRPIAERVARELRDSFNGGQGSAGA